MTSHAPRGRPVRQLSFSLVPVLDVLLIVGSVGASELTLQMWQRKVLQQAVEEDSSSHRGFWNERAAELCVPAPEPPPRSRAGSMFEWIDSLEVVRTYRDVVWQRYSDCVDERVVVIPEELLRFKFDRADAFDMRPEALDQAKDRIRRLVDDNPDRRRIYIRGHTDRVGTDEHNYVLSSKRAWYVGQVVLEHLRGKGLDSGRDFELIPEGLGKTRPVDRIAGESDEAFDRRCRRIQVAFQRLRPGSGQS
jgi:outer membrane protein OmpA-like peptidoglycan-associated protein